MHDNIPDHLYNITEQVREPRPMRGEFCLDRPIQYEKEEEKSGKLPTVDSVQTIKPFRPLPYSCVGTLGKICKWHFLNKLFLMLTIKT